MARIVAIIAAVCLWASVSTLGPQAIAQESQNAQAAQDHRTKVLKDVSPEEIAAILDSAQIQNTITTGSRGEPLILVQQGDLKFIIRGVDCIIAEETRCTKLQFRASIGLDQYPSAAWMNDFNKKWIFGKAYVSANGIANVEYPINLTEGITRDNLLNNMVLWSMILDTFIEHLEGGEIAPLM